MPNRNLFPPHSLDSERAVLAGMMLSSDAAAIAAETLTRDMFYNEQNGLMFGCLKHMHSKSIPIDAVLIKEQLEKHGRLEASGGMDFILELHNETHVSGHNTERYCEIVHDKYQRRRLLEAATNAVESVYDETVSTVDLLNKVEQDVFSVVSEACDSDNTKTVGEVGKEIIEDLPVRMENKSTVIGLSTGYPSLDKYLLGLQPGQLYIIAARPSIGKSTLGMVNMPIKIVEAAPGTPVYLFSLEMTAKNLVTNMMCMTSGVDSVSIRTGHNSMAEFNSIVDKFGEDLYEQNIYINDSSVLKPSDIRIKAKSLVRKYGQGPVIIDYLQFVKAEDKKMDKRAAVGDASRTFKALSKDLDVPVVLLSQLNRNAEERSKHEPMMSDLRESGEIEQDADVVMLLNRPEYYGEEPKNTMVVKVAKNRSGPTGKINLHSAIDKFQIIDYNS